MTRFFKALAPPIKRGESTKFLPLNHLPTFPSSIWFFKSKILADTQKFPTVKRLRFFKLFTLRKMHSRINFKCFVFLILSFGSFAWKYEIMFVYKNRHLETVHRKKIGKNRWNRQTDSKTTSNQKFERTYKKGWLWLLHLVVSKRFSFYGLLSNQVSLGTTGTTSRESTER